MSADAQRQINQELLLIERFIHAYAQQFASVIRDLNADPTPQVNQRALRLCVESAHMLLLSQQQLLARFRDLAAPQTTYPDEP